MLYSSDNDDDDDDIDSVNLETWPTPEAISGYFSHFTMVTDYCFFGYFYYFSYCGSAKDGIGGHFTKMHCTLKLNQQLLNRNLIIAYNASWSYICPLAAIFSGMSIAAVTGMAEKLHCKHVKAY